MDYKYRKRGGQEGWAPTPSQMRRATLRFYPDAKYTDLAIPVPGAPKQPCSDEKHRGGGEPGTYDWDYWESGDGSHGWCCSVCGLILQWG